MISKIEREHYVTGRPCNEVVITEKAIILLIAKVNEIIDKLNKLK